MPIILKTAKISLFSTLAIGIPIIFLPQYVLYPLLGSEDMSLMVASQPVLYIILVILSVFSIQ